MEAVEEHPGPDDMVGLNGRDEHVLHSQGIAMESKGLQSTNNDDLEHTWVQGDLKHQLGKFLGDFGDQIDQKFIPGQPVVAGDMPLPLPRPPKLFSTLELSHVRFPPLAPLVFWCNPCGVAHLFFEFHGFGLFSSTLIWLNRYPIGVVKAKKPQTRNV